MTEVQIEGGRPLPTISEEGTAGDNSENDEGHPGQCTTERWRCPISNRIWWLTSEGTVQFERERYKCTNTGRIWWQTADGVVRFEDELTCEGPQKGEQLLNHTFVLIDELTHSTGSTGCEAKANETCAVAGLAANIKSPMKPEMTRLPPAAEDVRLRQNMEHWDKTSEAGRGDHADDVCAEPSVTNRKRLAPLPPPRNMEIPGDSSRQQNRAWLSDQTSRVNANAQHTQHRETVVPPKVTVSRYLWNN